MNTKNILPALLFLITFYNAKSFLPHNIAILGTGYVGLTTGTCLAECGHTVICADINSSKIKILNEGKIPFYEKGLQELVTKNCAAKRLSFTDDCGFAISNSDIVFIAVGTPNINDQTDLSAFMHAVDCIANNLNTPKVICIKSTVPLGTAKKVKEYLNQKGIPPHLYLIISNPEFLREGTSIYDFFNADRIVIGTDSPEAKKIMEELYEPLKIKDIPLLYTDHDSAELIKYASNAYLSVKLSFVNELANLCECTQANTQDVLYGMGLDARIGLSFIHPGPGFGGSCLPKDCAELLQVTKKFKSSLSLLQTAINVNQEQKKKPVKKLINLLKTDLQNKTIAVLGLSFKANTDDVRCSPAITVIEELLKNGAHVKAYDPVANNQMALIFPSISYFSSTYEAIEDADACIIMTEWEEFRELNIYKMNKLMKQPYLIDMRNLLDRDTLKNAGFIFYTIGKPIDAL